MLQRLHGDGTVSRRHRSPQWVVPGTRLLHMGLLSWPQLPWAGLITGWPKLSPACGVQWLYHQTLSVQSFRTNFRKMLQWRQRGDYTRMANLSLRDPCLGVCFLSCATDKSHIQLKCKMKREFCKSRPEGQKGQITWIRSAKLYVGTRRMRDWSSISPKSDSIEGLHGGSGMYVINGFCYCSMSVLPTLGGHECTFDIL